MSTPKVAEEGRPYFMKPWRDKVEVPQPLPTYMGEEPEDEEL